MKSAFQCFVKNWSQNRHFALGLTILLTCLVRLGPMLVLATYQFNPRKDHWAFGHEWARIAKWLLEREMFSLNGEVPTAAWDPFYAFVIVPFFQFFGIYSAPSALAILLFQVGLGAVFTWVIFVLAEKCYGAFEARAAALLFALYPAAIFFSINRVGPASLIVLLIGSIFLAVMTLQRTQQYRYALLAGVLMGVLALTSSKTQTLIAVIPIWLWFAGHGTRVRRLISGSLFVVMVVLTVLPWSIRNGITLGHFTLSRSDFSYHLWRGNNPDATGYAHTDVYAPSGVRDPRTISQAQYRQMAVAWIIEHPQKFAQLTMKRMRYFWHKIAEDRRKGKQALGDTIHTWSFMVVLGLALVGLFGSRGHFNRVSLILLFLATYPLVFYLTHVTLYRYRFPIEPFLLVLASRGLYGLWSIVTISRRHSAVSEETSLDSIPRDPVGTAVAD